MKTTRRRVLTALASAPGALLLTGAAGRVAQAAAEKTWTWTGQAFCDRANRQIPDGKGFIHRCRDNPAFFIFQRQCHMAAGVAGCDARVCPGHGD